MRIETHKLHLIERLMRISKIEVLKKYEDLLGQAELIYRNQESLDAIEKGETISLSEFRESNIKWLKSQSIK